MILNFLPHPSLPHITHFPIPLISPARWLIFYTLIPFSPISPILTLPPPIYTPHAYPDSLSLPPMPGGMTVYGGLMVGDAVDAGTSPVAIGKPATPDTLLVIRCGGWLRLDSPLSVDPGSPTPPPTRAPLALLIGTCLTRLEETPRAHVQAPQPLSDPSLVPSVTRGGMTIESTGPGLKVPISSPLSSPFRTPYLMVPA